MTMLGNHKKGIVFTIVVIFLFLPLVEFALFTNTFSTEKQAALTFNVIGEKFDSLEDDIATTYQDVSGFNLEEVYFGPEYVRISVEDFQITDRTAYDAAMTSYDTFVEGTLANQTNVGLSTTFTNKVNMTPFGANTSFGDYYYMTAFDGAYTPYRIGLDITLDLDNESILASSIPADDEDGTLFSIRIQDNENDIILDQDIHVDLNEFNSLYFHFNTSSQHSNITVLLGGGSPPNITPTVAEFNISGGEITFFDNGSVDIEVLGTAITYGQGGPDIPVTVDAIFNGTSQELYGGSAVSGGENEEVQIGAGATLVLEGTAHLEQIVWWQSPITYQSTDTDQVITARDGDQPPEFDPYGGQPGLVEFVEPILDNATGTITIDDNQVVWFFELGSTNPSSSAFDMQDLVVLATVDSYSGGESTPGEEGNAMFIVNGTNINATIDIDYFFQTPSDPVYVETSSLNMTAHDFNYSKNSPLTLFRG